MKKLKFLLMSVVMVFAVISCDKNDEVLDTAEYDSLLKSATVDGVLLEDFKVGNAETECAQVACDGEFSFKIEAYNDDGVAEGEHAAEGGNTITILNSGEKVFDWKSEWPVCAVIVKGGPEAVVYYMEGATEGSGFMAPMNRKNGKAYGVSHVTFCYSMPPQIIVGKVKYTELVNDVTRKRYATTDGDMINKDAVNLWCRYIRTSPYENGTIDILTPNRIKVGELVITNDAIKVNLDEEYTLTSAHLFIGNEELLLSDGTSCPDYENDPWIVNTTGEFPRY